MLHIKNATVHTPDRVIERGSVLVEERRIVSVGPSADAAAAAGAREIDAAGLVLAPGFVELQLNGAFGHDFTDDPATIWQVGERITRYGVTSFLPTIITSPLEQVAAGRKVVTDGRPAGYRGAVPLGLHVEGPFLNPKRKGAHNANYLRLPSLDAVADWSPATGVRLVTLAPELPGALDVIRALTARGVAVSIGHSDATFDQAVAGFDAGARYGTHLFNAQSSLGHRDPGVPGALLSDDRITVGFIADGVHTHRAIIKIVYKVLGPSRMSLVTDAMAALGMAPGAHKLGDYDVIVDATSARLPDGVLAGSILALDQALRNVIEITGCGLSDALAMMTSTPARLLGLDGALGRIAPGCAADLVLLSPDLRVRQTIVGGEVVFTA
ncbi:MAG TPA: N-acetylglucosamine-6-phosphate deacetylase [Vicinamibacterales bacterium]|nr:N-acetylglucosamine-6-phosphate deacetylase [Vicinamibacterales bacterium]HOG29665.1 N-acetylglucosamine-6-phosphate deacetylase [Vicinamibacterales bacterium]HOQ61601.1 N-acetylglucosamine-6-phosphate deacetylase [Vicinamibacterales bacterium]HPW19433.1 N-acetylglucosamine-6-phosphate deacetylase [Vicinamibacterales bacterium]